MHVGMKITKGTNVDKVYQIGYYLLLAVFKNIVTCKANVDDKNGIVNSMQYLRCHIKPYSEEHILLSMLTEAF